MMELHPQKEYWLITESELNELALYFREHKFPAIAKRGGAIISAVSSRPASHSASEPAAGYRITEDELTEFLDYVEDDDNHTEEKYKNARGLAGKIRIRSRPVASHSVSEPTYSWDWCLGCPRENKCMLYLTEEQCQEVSERDKKNAAKQARAGVLEKMVNILAAHTIQSDDFAADGIKSGWILTGGWEPVIEDIEALREQEQKP